MERIKPIVVCCFIVGAFSAAGVQGLFCHQCLDGEWAPFCNASANQQQCADGDACFTQIKNANGVLTAWKGCMPQQQCAGLDSNNDQYCGSGVVQDKCTWCCQDHLCNYDRFSYSNTTPRPTTTTTPATTTAETTPAPPQPGGCSLADFQHCIMGYRVNVLKALVNPASRFTEFCRDVPAVFQCLANSVQTCGATCDVSATLNPVLRSLQSQCPQSCNTTAGLHCTLNVQERIIRVLLSVDGTCQLLQREVHACYECVAFSTSSCGTTVYRSSVSVVEQAVKLVCDGMVPVTAATLPPGRRTTAGPTTTTSTTTTTATPTTESGSSCHVEQANRCISELGRQIMRVRAEELSYDEICSTLLQQTEECAITHTAGCDLEVKHRVSLALKYVYALLDGECTPTTPAPVCDTTAARLCIVQLWQLVEEKEDFQRACDLVENTTRCVVEKTTDCTLDEKESLNKTLQLPLDKIGQRCNEPVSCPSTSTIVVEEGGDTKIVDFKFNYFPTTMCKGSGCKLYVDFLPEQGQEPRCSNRVPISQLVIGAVEAGQKTPYSTKEITDSNWNDVHQFAVAAKVDFKRDGNQTRHVNIVMRMVLNGKIVERRTICVLTVYIVDKDRSKNRCQLVGDPHISTFDSLYYNNFYEGFYTLYRHTSLPYEVQGVFQRCGQRGSCTCAVAIRAGDSVFVLDKCRRTSDRRRCNRRNHCGGTLKSRMYFWDQVTPGFRVFSRDEGRRFDILMPHGTKIRVGVGQDVLSAVHITPSPTDWGRTEGLCGVYDGNERNELQLPNGDIYTGRGAKGTGLPRDFCKSWGIPKDDHIFNGVPRNTYSPPVFCESRPTIDAPDSAPYTECGTEELLELCELATGGEITYTVPREPTIDVSLEPLVLREKRATDEQTSFTDTFDVELDADFDPEDEGVDVPGDWTQAQAVAYCTDYMMNQLTARLCQQLPGFSADVELHACVQDILVTGNTTFALAALEALKHECMEEMLSDTTLTASDEGLRTISNIRDSSCINECSGHGICVRETCRCEEPFIGEDCSIDRAAPIQNTEISWGGLCPTRLTDCSKVVVFGESFVNTESLTCLFTEVQVNEDGVHEANASHSVRAIHISFNQIICPLPGHGQAYHVQVSNDAHLYSAKHLYLPFDATCYDCEILQGGGAICKRKVDSCVIDDVCYGPGETSSEDKCKQCNPSKSQSSWSSKSGGDCSNTTVIIVAAVVVILLIFIVIVIIAIVIFIRRRGKNAATRQEKAGKCSHHTSHINMGEHAPLTPDGKVKTSSFSFPSDPVYCDPAHDHS